MRRWHVHTQHPLELTDVLNGMDVMEEKYQTLSTTNASKLQPDDHQPQLHSKLRVKESWESMLPDVHAFLEWLVANRQNSVEWVLLWASSWQEFAVSPLRHERLRHINGLCRDVGIACGAVCRHIRLNLNFCYFR